MNNIIEKIRALAAKYYNGGGYVWNITHTTKKGEELRSVAKKYDLVLDRTNDRITANTPKLFEFVVRYFNHEGYEDYE